MPADNDTVYYYTYGIDSEFFTNLFGFITGNSFSLNGLLRFIDILWTTYSIIALSLSALFIFGIIYAYTRIGQMSEIEAENIARQEQMWKELHGGSIENNRWASVQEHLASNNPNDWKLAIIEADVLLERMLEKAGYAGNTVGERLKSASIRSFATLDDAWTAHRVRNQIAHGGTDFVLTQKIANETLILYERVFKEFDVL